MARGLDLRAIAITDHDTLAGIAEGVDAARGSELAVIPGVEVSVDHGGLELHLLGYWVDDDPHSSLAELLAQSRDWRLDRARAILDRLARLGIEVSWERLCQIAGEGAIGRPHVGQALVELGIVESIRQAFGEYLAEGCPAWVSRKKLYPDQAISAMIAAGGVPVLAHPWGLMNLLPDLVAQGLAGIEAYYAGYGPERVALLERYARQHDLLLTGGSDFHGLARKPDSPLGGVYVPDTCLRDLMAYAGRQGIGTAVSAELDDRR